MRKICTLLPVVALCAASPAYAQAVGFSPRVELRVGHDELRAELEIEDSALSGDTSENGIGYGVEAGVDFIGSTFLIGAYGGIEFSDINGCSRVFEDDFDADQACLKAGSNITAGIRGGIPLGDGNFYVKGGYSRGRIKASYFNEFDGELFSDSERVGGYHLGGGVELGLAQLGLAGFYLKGEYVYTNYRDAFTDDLAPNGESFDPSRHQLVAGVGFRFGGAPAPIVVAPAPLPPAPVEAAPATQTCADGTVILATDTCPAPPPAPVPAPERG